MNLSIEVASARSTVSAIHSQGAAISGLQGKITPPPSTAFSEILTETAGSSVQNTMAAGQAFLSALGDALADSSSLLADCIDDYQRTEEDIEGSFKEVRL